MAVNTPKEHFEHCSPLVIRCSKFQMWTKSTIYLLFSKTRLLATCIYRNSRLGKVAIYITCRQTQCDSDWIQPESSQVLSRMKYERLEPYVPFENEVVSVFQYREEILNFGKGCCRCISGHDSYPVPVPQFTSSYPAPVVAVFLLWCSFIFFPVYPGRYRLNIESASCNRDASTKLLGRLYNIVWTQKYTVAVFLYWMKN